MAPLPYRDVKASGIRLRVTDIGDGPTLLLLHTTLLDRTTWDGLVQHLSEDFRVVAPDLPGFGESEKPGVGRFDYTVSSFAHVVTDLFAGLGLGQAHVVGHGLGGAIAMAIASRSPELVSRLGLINALCYSSKTDSMKRMAVTPMLGGFVFKQLWGKAMFRAYCRDVLTSTERPMSSERVDHYYEIFNTPSARNSALATFRATRDTRSVVADVARISVPTLVLWGRHDPIYPAALGQRLSRELRHAGFQLLDSGHCPSEEQSELLARVLRRFCLAERTG